MKYSHRLILISLVLLMVGTMLFSSKSIFAQQNKATHVHAALASGKVWLNTERNLTADELAGRVILLDFWTYCCINCMHVIPDLKYLEEKFGDKLTVIGVHSAKFTNEKDSENIRSAILRYGIEHPVINDFDFAIWNRFGVHAWPSFILISPNGRIDEEFSGEGHRDALEERISELLEEYEGKLITSKLPISLEKNKVPSKILSFPGKILLTENFAPVGEEDNTDSTIAALFIADTAHQKIQIVSLKDGIIIDTIGSGKAGLRDGDLATAEFNTPQGMAYDSKNRKLYIADTNNHSLRAIDFVKRKVITIAGTGKQGYNRRASEEAALSTALASPWDLEFFPDENKIIIAMAGTHQLWDYNITNQTVSVVAGNGRESIDDGSYPFNSLSQPSGLSAIGNKLYFVDSETSSLRVFENGEIRTLIGTGLFDYGFVDGEQGRALMQHAIGVHATEDAVYIADSYNHSIRKFNPETNLLSTVYGNGKKGTLNEPHDLLVYENKIYIADTNNSEIKIFDLKTNEIKRFEVMPASKSENALTVSNVLPNLKETFNIVLQPNKKISLNILLQDGWKINEEAPTWLAIFDQDGKLLKQLGYNDLKNLNTEFTQEIITGATRIQGTFYYCEKEEGAACLVQSYDSKLKFSESGVDTIQINIGE